jgi:hypothetical protein
VGALAVAQTRCGVYAVLCAWPALVRAQSIWSSPIAVQTGGGQPLTAVSCPSGVAAQCTAVDFSGREVTFDPGAPGAPTPSPVDAGFIDEAIACPAQTQCTEVDAGGRKVTFDPKSGGNVTEAAADPGQALDMISCFSGSRHHPREIQRLVFVAIR